MAAWSELPEDLLALVFARIFFPVDRACFQAVCRSWRSAARPPARQLPWIVFPNGGVMTPFDRVVHRIASYPKAITSCVGMALAVRAWHRFVSLPKTTTCIGSTDGWIAIDDRVGKMYRNYLLHNMFSGTTLSLPELDAAIGHVSKLFNIRKVLLRSTPDDVIALMTNHRSCPIILTRLGKGVWLPKSYAAPLVSIIDVAFLGDRLYGVTKDEDLVFLDIAFNYSGVPIVTGGKCVIGEGFDHDDYDDHDTEDDDLTKMTKKDMVPQEFRYIDVDESMENDIKTMWYLIESRGKLLMVRRQVVTPFEFTHTVEVFEADMRAAMWVPVEAWLEDQALFISRRFSKSVSAAFSTAIQKDAIYFADTEDVFDMRSQTVSAQGNDLDSYNAYLRSWNSRQLMWVFPPELVA
ncbi:unnamed protein product [Triticum turgidum subsp. durum]|uniref:F-box domain-containing protein n=1 Tax=Triticum turgidum subsp. durum TaxID=4567 RepID=A0A9R0VCR8_TRITD|nr:unnamed protein product [Triticum turgidum subsp. durum]